MINRIDIKLRIRYKNYKHKYKTAYKRLIRARIKSYLLYQNYRTWRIRFKTWRYHQSWHRSLMRLRYSLSEKVYFLFRSSETAPGTAEWLTNVEIKYGGKIWAVEGSKSPADPIGGIDKMMVGGDRMLHQGYANTYATFLSPYVQHRNQRYVVCEVGILRGTGLAIWCDLFPNSRCIGLDIDLSNVRGNIEHLKSLGAFGNNTPELHHYDQYVYSKEYLEQILNGDRIDIFIDDGAHTEESIMVTMSSVQPHLNEQFIYFVEDNWDVHSVIESQYQEWTIRSESGITVINSSPTV